jgi:hypothetical protein
MRFLLQVPQNESKAKDTPILYSYPTQKPTKFVVWVTKNWTQNWPTTWNWLTLLYMCLALLEKKKTILNTGGKN